MREFVVFCVRFSKLQHPARLNHMHTPKQEDQIMTVFTSIKRLVAARQTRRQRTATRLMLADLPPDVQRDIGVRRSGAPINPDRSAY